MSNHQRALRSPIRPTIITAVNRDRMPQRNRTASLRFITQKIELLKDFCIIDGRNKMSVTQYTNYMKQLGTEVAIENYVSNLIQQKQEAM